MRREPTIIKTVAVMSRTIPAVRNSTIKPVTVRLRCWLITLGIGNKRQRYDNGSCRKRWIHASILAILCSWLFFFTKRNERPLAAPYSIPKNIPFTVIVTQTLFHLEFLHSPCLFIGGLNVKINIPGRDKCPTIIAFCRLSRHDRGEDEK